MIKMNKDTGGKKEQGWFYYVGIVFTLGKKKSG